MKFLSLLGNIKNRVLKSTFIKNLYNLKWYFDLGSAVVGWFLTKGPEIASVIIILSFFEVKVSKPNMVSGIIIAFCALLLIGYFYKQLGLYDRKQHVTKTQDPIMQEIYKMAKEWNKQNGTNKK